MPNPIKVLKGVKKVTGKAMRGKANSKGLKETNVKGIEKITTGTAKAAMRMAKAGQYDSNTKGLGLVKGSNKKTAKQNLMANKIKKAK